MSDVVEKLLEAGHLTPAQVDRIGEDVHELVKAAKENPELLNEYLQKTGGFGSDILKYMGQAAPAIIGGTLAAGAVAAGTGVLGRAYDEIKGSLTKARDYKNMLDKNPQLANYNADTVQSAFDTLHRFNPEYASDPLVAGTFVRNAAEQERVDVQQIHGLIQARKNLADVKSRSAIDPQKMVAAPIWTPDAGSKKQEDIQATEMSRALGRAEAERQLKTQQQQSDIQKAHAAFK